ncbi:MAG: hypothetical protein WCI72_00715 [archaeon]
MSSRQSERYSAKNLYFSAPIMLDVDGVPSTQVIVISKEQWDSYGDLNREKEECHGVRENLGKLLIESEEGIFELDQQMSCQELVAELSSRGLTYNSDLDSILEERAADLGYVVTERVSVIGNGSK